MKAGKWKRQEDQKRESQPKSQPVTSDFFNGCNNLESLNKRYRDLCKVYHPDMGNGSTEIFQKLNTEYEMLKKRMQ